MTENLLYFEPDFGTSTPTVPATITRVETTVPTVTERVRVHEEPKVTYIARPDAQWGYEELRDYVAAQIISRFGLFPRDTKKEIGIFKSFLQRWGAKDSAAIARYAFEVQDGRWRGAPVHIRRFCLNSDPYFATPIHEYLATNT